MDMRDSMDGRKQEVVEEGWRQEDELRRHVPASFADYDFVQFQ